MFLSADYAFSVALTRDTSALVVAAGGEVVGVVKMLLAAADMSSYLLEAQASGAQVIGIATAGVDTINVIKQAAEFGIGRTASSAWPACWCSSPTKRALGLQAAQGLEHDRIRLILRGTSARPAI